MELQNTSLDFKSLDSIYVNYEKSTADGIVMFNNNPKVEDFKIIDSLIASRFATFP